MPSKIKGKQTKRQYSEPTPKSLGTGMAAKAGAAVKGRKQSIDDKLTKYGA